MIGFVVFHAVCLGFVLGLALCAALRRQWRGAGLQCLLALVPLVNLILIIGDM